MNTQSLQFIFPELILLAFALGALVLGVFGRLKNYLGTLVFVGIALSATLLPSSLTAVGPIFSGMLVSDGFSVFFREIILLVAGLITLLSMGYKDLEKEDSGEYYFFLLVVTVAMMLAVSSSNLMMIYIALETVSIVSYIMAGFMKRDVFSSEAGMKYFLFGAFSTGVTLYGISLAYGLFGSLDLNTIWLILATGTVNQAVLFLVGILILVGFGFKCSLVPFHMWTPDVYQGAPTPVAALLSVGPKAMGFALLLRIFIGGFQAASSFWIPLAGFMAILTMTIGNIAALQQNNMKRLLAYSSIAQAGYILVGLAVATTAGIQSSLFYIFIYVLMNLGAFGVVVMISNSIKSEAMEDYAGLYKRSPWTAIVLTVSLLSLAGIPPLAGFLAKFFILAAAVEAKLIFLAVIVAVNSVVAIFYYLRIVKVMFLDEPRQDSVLSKNIALELALFFTLAGNILFGIFPYPILNWLSRLF